MIRINFPRKPLQILMLQSILYKTRVYGGVNMILRIKEHLYPY